MTMQYLFSLYKESPEKAIDATIAKFGKRIVNDNEDFKFLSASNRNVLRDKIIEFYENNKFEKLNDDDLVSSIRESISKDVKTILKRYYDSTGSDIPFKEYVGYARLVFGQADSELVDYEDKGFTYSVPNGTRKIRDVRDRIFDSLTDMYYVFHEELASGEISVESFSFIVDEMNEIHALVSANDIETALEKTVALQLYFGFGTKFLPTLKRFLTGELLISSYIGYNGIINDKGRER